MLQFFAKINPLTKIIFIFSQLIFIYFFKNSALTYSVIFLFLLINFSTSRTLKKSLNNSLKISPLLLSLLILGYLFGNPVEKDLRLIFYIGILAIYTFTFIYSTNSYQFVAAIHNIVPARIKSPATTFSYGLVYFSPKLINTIRRTVVTYKSSCGSVKNFKTISSLFSSILQKITLQVQTTSHNLVLLQQKLPSAKFSKYDYLPVILIILQITLLFIWNKNIY